MKTKSTLFILSLAILAACDNSITTITVSNPLDLDRTKETVSVSLEEIGVADSESSNILICDKNGNSIPIQILDGQVLFQADVASGSESSYTVRIGEGEVSSTVAYSRHVPERMDDYAYENNLVAGRIYGPALETPRTFGQDIWVKCTDKLVIDEWFKIADYHTNRGEGMDCYKVANTLGGGAVAPYSADKIVIGDNWAEFQHLCDGPIRTAAEFTHPEFEVDGVKVQTKRSFHLDASTRFLAWTTIFEADCDSVDVVLGAVVHDVISREDGTNYIAYTEKASDSKDPERDGNISIGLILDSSIKAEACTMDGHAVLKFKVKTGETIRFWTGSGWSQGGVESPQEWQNTVKNTAKCLDNPLKITIKR